MAHVLEKDSAGFYCVCVFNADTASDEEITDVFKQFGPVISINRCKQLAFVRYAAYEEASRCLEKMEGHSQFTVRPAKRKIPDKPEYQRDRFNENRGAEGSSWNGNNRSFQSAEKPTAMKTMPALKWDEPETGAGMTAEMSYRVILAHLPPDMLQCDIIHLCTKAARSPPLHVDMKSFTRHPHSPVYYAIAYVKSISDVDSIARGLNNLKVNGYQMVVASYKTLNEEGKTAHRDN